MQPERGRHHHPAGRVCRQPPDQGAAAEPPAVRCDRGLYKWDHDQRLSRRNAHLWLSQHRAVRHCLGQPNQRSGYRCGAGSAQGYRKNMVLHPRAITLATVDLPLFQKGVVDAAREVFDGISMRCLQTYYPQTDQLIFRIDVLYGFAALRPGMDGHCS